MYVLPNGDVLVAESNKPAAPSGQAWSLRAWVTSLVMKRAGAVTPGADRITLLRDTDGDGVAETRSVFVQQLHSPFGMALVGDQLHVANSDGVVRLPCRAGALRIDAPPQVVTDLPAGRNHHWTKNLLASPHGRRLYATVGSNSNAGENGSWTRRPLVGYEVVFIPFANGAPVGPPKTFFGGFLSPEQQAWGRPVGVALDGRGGVLVADDVGNTVWRIAPLR